MRAWEGDDGFRELLERDEDVRERLGDELGNALRRLELETLPAVTGQGAKPPGCAAGVGWAKGKVKSALGGVSTPTPTAAPADTPP